MRIGLKILTICFVFLFPLFGWAQEINSFPEAVNQEAARLSVKLSGKKYIQKKIYRGRIFLFDDWLKGDLLLEDGTRLENITIKYDTYLDELIYYNSVIGALIVIEKSIIDEFTLKNSEWGDIDFIKMPNLKKSGEYTYYEKLYEGEIRVFIQYYTKEHIVSAYYDDNGILRNSDYVFNEDFYIEGESILLTKFIPKRKSFLNMYPENKRDIRRILRRNNIRIFDRNSIPRAFMLIEQEGL